MKPPIDGRVAQRVCATCELVEVGRDGHGAGAAGGVGLDDSFAHRTGWAVQVHRRRLLRQDAHALGALEQDARGHRLEEVQRLAVGDLFAVAEHEHHAGTWLVAKLGAGNVDQGMATEPVWLGQRRRPSLASESSQDAAHAFGNVGGHAFDENEVALPTESDGGAGIRRALRRGGRSYPGPADALADHCRPV